MLRVLIVHNDYQQYGGETAAVKAQIELLRQRGHRVFVYWRDNKEILGYGFKQKLKSTVCTFFSLKTFHEITTLVRKERPDVAHIHNVFPLISPSVYWALKVSKVPIIQTLHNYRFLCPNALFYTNGAACELCKNGNTLHAVRLRCYRESYAFSALYALTIGLHRRLGTFGLVDHFLPVTNFIAKKLVESGLADEGKVTVLGNFLNDAIPKLTLKKSPESYLVYIGRLSPEKGLMVLLDALAGLSEVKLKIAGSGPQARMIQEKAQRYNLPVELVGFAAGERKWELLYNSIASVIPSLWYEGFPFAALESMIAGKPVIASDIGGLSELVENGRSGLLFNPGDSCDLREKLEWIIDHPDEAASMGRYGYEIAERKYSAESHYQQLMRVYQQVKSSVS